MKGLFITFEGPDGAGKTTQVRMLSEKLKMLCGGNIVVTREPGGTAIGDQIRKILLSPDHQEMAEETEVLLYAASRAQHVREVIAPALSRGDIVLCDRYIDASIAYQAYGLGQDPEEVAEISRYASGNLQPHRTYLLDVPAEVSRERLLLRSGKAGLDRIEQKGQEYHERVREGFLALAKLFPDRIQVIDATRSPEEIASDIYADCEQWLKGRLQPSGISPE